ncbi:CRISPR-associated ring nuclease Csm6 [Rappaport israeli]|uniref:CRISPR-associated ring nuclease Csm6 n=1 Tax=Rappaport israeli TaxID=1839807 RepID=UPI000931C291|nr:CRISPR-associated ring nuclease Csm6 [Rappaport israeli]
MIKRNILFLVTGMTPQIITETLWALACDPDRETPWIPDEIHVLTTADGSDQIRARLFDEGIFTKIKNDYPVLANVQFTIQHLHLIKDNGTDLKDLKTPLDNELAANAICAQIQAFTQDEHTALHVSIAGGRKTMGFYAGYALSLYGRHQDRLSHVLVESDFESTSNFYYPTPSDYFVTQRNTDKRLNAKDAQIWLAEIPFVRMQNAINNRHQLKSDASFSEVVDKINQSYEKPSLTIDLRNKVKTITINHKYQLKLEPKEFAFLYWFADLRKNNKAGVQAPKKNKKDEYVKRYAQYIDDITMEYNEYYKKIKFKDVFSYDDDSLIYLYKNNFEIIKSNLKSCIEKQLGIELASKFEIVQDKRNAPFYLNLDPASIEIIN